MATLKPRVSITLEPEQYDVLSRLSELQGRPMATILREFVDAIGPGLARVVEIGELYQQANDATRQHFIDGMNDAALVDEVAALEQAAGRLLGRMGPGKVNDA